MSFGPVYEIKVKCQGCGTAWTQAIEQGLTSAEELKRYLETNLTGCPKNCGSLFADVALRIGPETKHG